MMLQAKLCGRNACVSTFINTCAAHLVRESYVQHCIGGVRSTVR